MYYLWIGKQVYLRTGNDEDLSWLSVLMTFGDLAALRG